MDVIGRERILFKGQKLKSRLLCTIYITKRKQLYYWELKNVKNEKVKHGGTSCNASHLGTEAGELLVQEPLGQLREILQSYKILLTIFLGLT